MSKLEQIVLAGVTSRERPFGSRKVLQFSVEVWQRRYPVDTTIKPGGEVVEYQADIFTNYAGDHHGIGDTPGAALAKAALHLNGYELK